MTENMKRYIYIGLLSIATSAVCTLLAIHNFDQSRGGINTVRTSQTTLSRANLIK